MLEALRARNRAGAAACTLARAHEAVLTDVTMLEATALMCERLQQEAAVAKAAEAQAAEAAQLVGEKLAEAQAKAADLEHNLQQSTSREASLQKENETLLARLTELLQMRAMDMDTEREQFEEERERAEAAIAASKAEAAASAPASDLAGAGAAGGGTPAAAPTEQPRAG